MHLLQLKMLDSPGLMGDIGTKVPANNAVPCGVVPDKDHHHLDTKIQCSLSYFLSNSFLM